MVRTTKKKKVINPFERDQEVVLIHPSTCESFNQILNNIESTNSTNNCDNKFDPIYILELIEGLKKCVGLGDQIKLIQSKKGLIRTSITSIIIDLELNSSIIKSSIQLLLHLYIHPSFICLRKSFEWVIETDVLKKCKCLPINILNEVIKDTCVLIWNSSLESSAGIVHNDGGDDSNFIDKAMGWAYTFNIMSIIEKEIPWLDYTNNNELESKHDNKYVNDDDNILLFINSIKLIFDRCAEKISLDIGDNNESNKDVNGSQFLRYAECCGECMKAILNLLKSRSDQVIPKGTSSKWYSSISAIMTSGFILLYSDHVHKDIMTQISIGLVTMQWMCRYHLSATDDDNVSSLQLFAINGLLRLDQFENIDIEFNNNSIINSVYLSHDGKQLNYIEMKRYSEKTGLHPLLVNGISSSELPIIARCSVLRAILSVFNDISLSYSPSVYSSSLYLSVLFDSAMSICSHCNPLVRFYGLQTFESWFNRIQSIDITLFSNDCTTLNLLISKLKIISTLLTTSWSHPSKQFNHLVPAVYQRLIDVLSLIHTKIKEKNDNTKEEIILSLWRFLISEAVLLPGEHRGRYQTMSVLLPKVGAIEFINSQPMVITSLISAARLRDVCSSAASLLGNLLRNYFNSLKSQLSIELVISQQDNIQANIRLLWLKPLVEALCSSDNTLKNNAANYLLPEILSVDNGCVSSLMCYIRSTNFDNGDRSFLIDRKLWGMVNVCMQARLLNLPGKDILITDINEDNNLVTNSINSGSLLTTQELAWACVSDNSDLRLVSLTLIMASHSSLQEIKDHELEVIKRTLKYSLKSPHMDHRHRVIRIVKMLATKCTELIRTSRRDVTKIDKRHIKLLSDHKKLLSESNDEIQIVKSELLLLESTEMSKKLNKITQDSFNVCEWLRDELQNNLYPGTTFDREVMAIDLINCVIDVCGKTSDHIQCFFTESMTNIVLTLLVSSWDKSRRAAADLIKKFPSPLPGHSSPIQVNTLISWGCSLTGSAKQRESEAGALILKVLFSIYCVQLGWDNISVPLDSLTNVVPVSNSFDKSNSTAILCAAFINNMSSLLENRRHSLEIILLSLEHNDITVEIEDKTAPLCHGLMMALKFCLNEARSSGLFELKNVTDIWQPVVNRVLDVCIKSLQTSLTVVAEAATDVSFAPITPGNIMSGSYVNTNSVMGSGTVGEMQDENGSESQRAVVAAWLLVKESTSMLATLVEMSPPPPPPQQQSQSAQLLTVEQISMVGATILDALGRLKHMGAIAEAHNSLQIIAECLLKHGERCIELCRLPHQWLLAILGRLENKKQVFILRRSAGFAYSFLSILRAEPANCKPALLHIAMKSLLQHVEKGLEGLYNPLSSNEIETIHEPDDNIWRICVHSLNVLRLILCDGALGQDLDIYIARTAILAVRGFRSPKWAVRNSSMMVFSAVVQRSVDNDKNEASAKAATAIEFFQRMPTLFPFLLAELASITSHKVIFNNEWPESIEVDVNKESGNKSILNKVHEGGLNPSLYPLLLLISKLRTSFVASVTSSDFINDRNVDLSLFIPLILSCSNQKVHYAREMAAKAFVSLIPIIEVPKQVCDILKKILASASIFRESGDGYGVCKTLTSNEMHGYLLLVHGMLRNLSRQLQSSLGDNKSFFRGILSEINENCIHLLANLVSSLSSIICPPIHTVFSRVLNIVDSFISSDVSSALLIGQCRVSLQFIISNKWKSHLRFPFAPIMWKESLVDMVLKSILQNDCNNDHNDAYHPYSIIDLFDLLEHPISEVREGLLEGCKLALEKDNAHSVHVLFQEYGLIIRLLDCARREKEPPISKLILDLMCR
jgi:hypothetical protein